MMLIRNPRNRTPGRGKAEWGQGGQVNSFLGEVGSRGYPGRTGSISADVEGARLGIGPQTPRGPGTAARQRGAVPSPSLAGTSRRTPESSGLPVPVAATAAAPRERPTPSRGSPVRLGHSAPLGSARTRGGGGAGRAAILDPDGPRATACAPRRRERPRGAQGAGASGAGGRAGGGGRERGWQRRKGVVGNRAAAASGLLSGGSAPLLPRLRRRRPSGKMPSAQGCEEGTRAAARSAATAAVARVL